MLEKPITGRREQRLGYTAPRLACDAPGGTRACIVGSCETSYSLGVTQEIPPYTHHLSPCLPQKRSVPTAIRAHTSKWLWNSDRQNWSRFALQIRLPEFAFSASPTPPYSLDEPGPLLQSSLQRQVGTLFLPYLGVMGGGTFAGGPLMQPGKTLASLFIKLSN